MSTQINHLMWLAACSSSTTKPNGRRSERRRTHKRTKAPSSGAPLGSSHEGEPLGPWLKGAQLLPLRALGEEQAATRGIRQHEVQPAKAHCVRQWGGAGHAEEVAAWRGPVGRGDGARTKEGGRQTNGRGGSERQHGKGRGWRGSAADVIGR
uniref:Uncharacterized protein n=1 Tax=Arundo donax TaxID=35708 RepID=A0A0A9F7D5_ARUDO